LVGRSRWERHGRLGEPSLPFGCGYAAPSHPWWIIQNNTTAPEKSNRNFVTVHHAMPHGVAVPSSQFTVEGRFRQNRRGRLGEPSLPVCGHHVTEALQNGASRNFLLRKSVECSVSRVMVLCMWVRRWVAEQRTAMCSSTVWLKNWSCFRAIEMISWLGPRPPAPRARDSDSQEDTDCRMRPCVTVAEGRRDGRNCWQHQLRLTRECVTNLICHLWMRMCFQNRMWMFMEASA